jgi:hypothetical protein
MFVILDALTRFPIFVISYYGLCSYTYKYEYAYHGLLSRGIIDGLYAFLAQSREMISVLIGCVWRKRDRTTYHIGKRGIKAKHQER